MLRPLCITNEIVKAAEAVKAHAYARRETFRRIADRMLTNSAGPADDEKHILLIPVGYRVVVSVEQHPEAGWLLHFAFSTEPEKGKISYPAPKAVQHILRECFGIRWNPNWRKSDPQYPDKALDIWDERNEQHLLFKTTLPSA